MRINAVIRATAWASGGVLVTLAWGYYFAAANKALPVEPGVQALAGLTQPAIAALLSFDPASRLSLYGSVLLNAATYGLLGLFVETIRQSHRPALSN